MNPTLDSPRSAVLPAFRQAIYNPNRLTDAEVKAAFIARRELLAQLLEDIDGTRSGGIPQHHFLVGQRGMGKTMTLRRLAAALREPDRQCRFLPLGFPEEQWTIDRLSKYWLNCLDSLADALEQAGGAEALVGRLDVTVARLRTESTREELLAEAAERAFLELAAESGRRPVLLVDNLDYVFERLSSHEMSRLRAALMKAGAPILIATGVAPPRATQHYEAPFYDHFKTHYLDRLSFQEMMAVLGALAVQAGHPDQAERLCAEQPRLTALHTLTGGNPRTVVILHQIFSHGFSEEAYQDLEALLDWMTPLYKARFEELSAQGQVVVGALASAWRPLTAGELGQKVQLENSQVSPQLDRLQKTGWVEETLVDPEDRTGPLPEGRTSQTRTGYQLAERFFNIWFLMRQATRRDRRSLAFLTRFLECIHTPTERASLARELLSHRGLSRASRIYGLALEAAVDDDCLRFELHDHVQQEIVEAHRRLREKIEDLIDPSEIPPHRYAFTDLKDKLSTLVPPDSPVSGEEFAEAVLGSPSLTAQRDALAGKKLNREDVEKLLGAVREEQEKLTARYDPTDVDWLRRLLRRGTLVDWRSPEQLGAVIRQAATAAQIRIALEYAGREAKRKLDEGAWGRVKRLLTPATEDVQAWLRWAYLLRDDLGQPVEAEAAARKALTLDPRLPEGWNVLGTALADQPGRADEGEIAIRKAIEIEPEYQVAWANLGLLLHHRLRRFEDAEAAYRKATELGLDDEKIWLELGDLLHHPLKRFEEAESAYRKALEIDPTAAFSWFALGTLLDDQRRFDEAEAAFRKAVDLEPTFQPAWRRLGILRYVNSDPDEAESALRRAVQLDPKDGLAWAALGTLLGLLSTRTADAEAAFERAIDSAPDESCVRFGLGSVLSTVLGRGVEAAGALKKAIELEPTDAFGPRALCIGVLRDQLGETREALAMFGELGSAASPEQREEILLHEALFAAHADNWGIAAEKLGEALESPDEPQRAKNLGVALWTNAAAVLLHLGYGERFLTLLQTRGEEQRLRPFYEAIRAHLRGDRKYLRNVPLEVRETAGGLYDAIGRQLKLLAPSTRRWSPPAGETRTPRKRRRGPA